MIKIGLYFDEIYKIKNREKRKSLALFCSCIDQIDNIAFLNKTAIKLIEKFTPGPITLILKSKIEDTIAVRIPDHIFTLQLLKELNTPIIATSVNSSGSKAATEISEIEIDIFKQFDLIIDGGKSFYSYESTIIDLTDEKINIVRKGALDIDDILKIYWKILYLIYSNIFK